MNSDQQIFWRRHAVFGPMNAHSQADDPTLVYVMRFNADESECQERRVWKQHIERIQDLPRAQQHSVVQLIDTLLAQWGR